MGFRWACRSWGAGATTAQSFAPRPPLSPRGPGRTSDPRLMRLSTSGRDECSSGGAGGECGVDVDDSWAVRIKADRDLRVRVLDLDLPLAVQGERTRPAAEVDSGAVIE